MSRRSARIGLAAVTLAAVIFAMSAPGTTATAPDGGIFRIYISQAAGLDHVDPALSFTPVGWALIDTFCARLLTYPDRPPPVGFRIVPEVAVGPPQMSHDAKTFTFTLRSDFRFSDGKSVRADAFARAINRTLDPGMHSPGAMHTRDIVGADDVLAGRARSARGVVARGRMLTIRLTHPAPDFPTRMTLPYFCAVPPNMSAEPEGVGVFAAAGPYHVVDYVPDERVVLQRNTYYRGSRPHHVNGFYVDLRAQSPTEMLQRIDRNEYDWGNAPAGVFFADPTLGLQQKYGINESRFFVKPGLSLRLLVFNSSRPLFRSNPKLRRAVNFALDRKALVATAGGPIAGTLTDQYLPFAVPGFEDADIYPLGGPDLDRARSLAQGNLRDGKAVLLTSDAFLPLSAAQLVKRQLEPLGIDVTLDKVPLHVASADYFDRLVAPDAAWDMALVLWTPNVPDAQMSLNLLLTGRLPGSQTLSRLESADYARALNKAAAVVSPQDRARAFGRLDAAVAAGAAPAAAINVMNEATLVSDRVGCIVLRPVLDLTSVCLLR